MSTNTQSKVSPSGPRLGSPGTKPRPTSSRTSGPGGNKPVKSPLGVTTTIVNASKGNNLNRLSDDQNEMFDPSIINDGGECMVLLDVFVTQDFLIELDNMMDTVDIHSYKKWGVPVTSSPVSNLFTTKEITSHTLNVLTDAEHELMLMTKWSERCRLRSPLPRTASYLSDADLRDRHLVQFFHSIYLWCKENSFTREESSVILGIGKLLLDRILATIPKPLESSDQSILPNQDKASSISSIKSGTSNTTKSTSGITTTTTTKKTGTDKFPSNLPPTTLATNLPIIPVPHLLPVLITYLNRLLVFHTINTTNSQGHTDGQKWQVLSPKITESVAHFYRLNLLNQIHLIRLAYGTSSKRYQPHYANTSRPNSSDIQSTISNTNKDDPNYILNVHPIRKSIGSSTYPHTSRNMPIFNHFKDPESILGLSDSDFDSEDTGNPIRLVGNSPGSEQSINQASADSSMSVTAGSITANQFMNELVQDMDQALNAIKIKFSS